jgi:long-subunit fatty acid transport protein
VKSIDRNPSPRRGSGILLTLVLGLAVASSGSSRAENLPEIPLTLQMPFSARYAGMGGASLAFADDHTACLANPATLALVRQIEFSAGLAKQSGRMDVGYYGNNERSEFGKARLSDLGFVYPFPTYRGSFVLGFAYGRISSLDSDYYRKGSGGQVSFEEEGILEDGGLGAYAMSMAFQATRAISMGATGTILSGDSFRSRTFRYQAGSVTADDYTTEDVDIKAITGNFGLLVDVAKGARLGLNLQLPANLDLDGFAHGEFYDGDSVYVDDYAFTDEVDLPFRLGAGLAIARSHVVVATDVIYTDWTAINFAGPVVSEQDRSNAYRETVEFKVGAEYLLSAPAPIRLRAGYAYMPLSYKLLLTQRVPSGGGIDTIYEQANITKERQYWTVGAGVLLAESLTLDLAYMDGGFARTGQISGPSIYQEDQTDRRFLATLTLRLPLDRN